MTVRKLKSLYDKYKDKFHCVYQKDIYTDEQWLEIMPFAASKANAIKQLQKLLECDRVVAFGDGRNDIDMFELADESYAVQNADEQLKGMPHRLYHQMMRMGWRTGLRIIIS